MACAQTAGEGAGALSRTSSPESESDHGLYLIRVDLRLAWTFREGAFPVGLILLNTQSARWKATGRPPTALTPSSLPGQSSGVGGDRNHKRLPQAPSSVQFRPLTPPPQFCLFFPFPGSVAATSLTV